MFSGAAAAYYESHVRSFQPPDETKLYLYKVLGGRPARGATDCAIRSTKRANDPNAGKTPPNGWINGPSQDGYLRHYQSSGPKDLRLHDRATTHMPNHIGGTMRPVQAYPVSVRTISNSRNTSAGTILAAAMRSSI
jgi:hypothetical protein